MEDGNTIEIDLSNLTDVGTDDQTISGNLSSDNILSLTMEDGNTIEIDLSNLTDVGTDDQTISGNLNSDNILSLTMEDGNTIEIDLNNLNDVGSDDQNITNIELNGTLLNITIEDGNTATVDLSPALSYNRIAPIITSVGSHTITLSDLDQYDVFYVNVNSTVVISLPSNASIANGRRITFAEYRNVSSLDPLNLVLVITNFGTIQVNLSNDSDWESTDFIWDSAGFQWLPIR